MVAFSYLAFFPCSFYNIFNNYFCNIKVPCQYECLSGHSSSPSSPFQAADKQFYFSVLCLFENPSRTTDSTNNKVICPSFSDTYSYSLALLFLLKEVSKTQYWKVILSKESYVISHNFFWVKMLQTHVSCSLPLEAPPTLISSVPDYYKCLLTAAQKLAVIPQDC